MDCKSLYYLENLITLNLKGNQIQDFNNCVAPILMTLRSLQKIELQGNPVTKIFKYRDQVVLLTRTLQELDGKMIKSNER